MSGSSNQLRQATITPLAFITVFAVPAS